MATFFVESTSADSTFFLPHPWKLPHHSVGLMEIHASISPRRKDGDTLLYLACDFVQNSALNVNPEVTLMLPLLRAIHFDKKAKTTSTGEMRVFTHEIHQIYNHPLFIPTSRSNVENFRLYIIDKTGNIPSLDHCNLKCTLRCSSWKTTSEK